MLIPKVPKRDELLNVLFKKFIEPKFIPLLLPLPLPAPIMLLLPVIFDCAIAGLLRANNDVAKITIVKNMQHIRRHHHEAT